MARENIIVKSFFFSSQPTVGPHGAGQLLAAARQGRGAWGAAAAQLSLSSDGSGGHQEVGAFIADDSVVGLKQP